MSLLKRRPRGEASYCEDAPSPAFKRLRLDSDLQDQQPPPCFEQAAQQRPGGEAQPGPGADADDAAAAALAHAHAAALLGGGMGGDYANINAILKQLHDERLQRAAAAAMAAASRNPEAAGTMQPR
ncbi:hypothetical protein Rsub_06183 [Raphidocelis subcapitata]|uniref:Uncharacterized protein n=1 Tax=Raphidocelis subcapitata TaxID=307507 RepID=A0A2V0P230_9CHLO|nr:hypothetical protein Rsub_06183 [Raphidocelis subcapitata]|eukprot:GBF93934.1 hypothetical protein Rsub_06183 [Raphidocelis subcapitata]